jgi:hypothetical protein
MLKDMLRLVLLLLDLAMRHWTLRVFVFLFLSLLAKRIQSAHQLFVGSTLRLQEVNLSRCLRVSGIGIFLRMYVDGTMSGFGADLGANVKIGSPHKPTSLLPTWTM